MTKRAYQKFDRAPRDFYATPPDAVRPLLQHLPQETAFHEPCAGDGALIDALEAHGHRCTASGDISPRREGILDEDAFTLLRCHGEMFITNPPWRRDLLHPMIAHFCSLAPTWLLFDADWMHTKQATDFLKHCTDIVSVGRVKWFGNQAGFDNCCWYKFTAAIAFDGTRFHEQRL